MWLEHLSPGQVTTLSGDMRQATHFMMDIMEEALNQDPWGASCTLMEATASTPTITPDTTSSVIDPPTKAQTTSRSSAP